MSTVTKAAEELLEDVVTPTQYWIMLRGFVQSGLFMPDNVLMQVACFKDIPEDRPIYAPRWRGKLV